MAQSMMKEAVTSTVHALRLEASGEYGEKGDGRRVDPAQVARIIENWGETPRTVAERVIEKYGYPNEAVSSRLIWYRNGPWKRTILYRDEVPHNFPKPHTDLLEQFIDYQVPVDRFSALAAFDGSVICERTKGEISARCDREEMNFLALNLAHDIVVGRRNVDEAREEYARAATAFMSGERPAHTSGLAFEPPSGATADSDQPVMSGMVQELMAQAKDMLGAN